MEKHELTHSALEEEFSGRALRRLIVPLVIEQLLAIMVGLLDSVMVTHVGEAAISAVSLVDTVNVLLVNAFAALATGGAVIAGQYLGRREGKKADNAAGQLMLFMVETSIAIMALLYLGRGFILGVVFGSVEPDVAAYARTYFDIVEASVPFLAIYSAGAALLRVMGNARASMWVSLLMNVINVAGNALLIFGLEMGVEGVAIPTTVSRGIAAVLMVALLRRPGRALRLPRPTLRHDRYVIRHILRFGVPNGMESGMFQLGKILLLSTVAVFGTASVAANAIGNTICTFQCVPGNALGLAIVTVVSRCIGAGSYEEARRYTKKLMGYTYLWMGSVVILSLIFLPVILGFYRVSAAATEYARQIVWLHGLVALVFWPPSFTLPQALRAAGDTRFTLTVSSVSMWTIRVGLGVLLGRFFGIGVLGIWISMCVDWVIRTGFFIHRFRGSKWEIMALTD